MALQELTFSDGTTIPEGTILVAPAVALHMDAELYPDPHIFNPWRFFNKHDGDEGSSRHRFVNTSLGYLPFGHGRHAWYVPLYVLAP